MEAREEEDGPDLLREAIVEAEELLRESAAARASGPRFSRWEGGRRRTLGLEKAREGTRAWGKLEAAAAPTARAVVEARAVRIAVGGGGSARERERGGAMNPNLLRQAKEYLE